MLNFNGIQFFFQVHEIKLRFLFKIKNIKSLKRDLITLKNFS